MAYRQHHSRGCPYDSYGCPYAPHGCSYDPHGCPYDCPIRRVINTQTEAIYPYSPGAISGGYGSARGRRGLGSTSQMPLGRAHPSHLVQRSRVAGEYASPYAGPSVDGNLEHEGAPTISSYRPAPRSHEASRDVESNPSAQRQNHTPTYDGDDARIVRHREPSLVPRAQHKSITRDDLIYDGQSGVANRQQGLGLSSRNPASELPAPTQHPYSAHQNAQNIRYQGPRHRLRTGYLSGEDLRNYIENGRREMREREDEEQYRHEKELDYAGQGSSSSEAARKTKSEDRTMPGSFPPDQESRECGR